jgi:hypothetical protein
VCDLETSRIGAPYIYDISNLRVKLLLMSVTSRIHTYTIDRLIYVVKNVKNAVCMAIENMSVKCCGFG